MKGINRSAVLELIRSHGPISRSAIAEQRHISLPTVMRIVDELTAEGLVKHSGIKEFSGGRKRPLIEFNGEDHLVIGLDLGGTKVFGAITDLCGNIRYENETPIHLIDAEESFDFIIDQLQALSSIAQRMDRKILGMGVSVPGSIDPGSVNINNAPSLQWHHFPFQSRIAEYFRYPIIVENDANLAALGELWFGGGRGVDSLVNITIGTGIGAGIIINGMIVSGAHSLAGEIGYFLPGREHLGKDYPEFGALEQLVSSNGIVSRAKYLLKDMFPEEHLRNLSADDIFISIRKHEQWAEKVRSEIVDYLALLISSMTLTLDPDVIILGGGVAQYADLLIDQIMNRLKSSMPIIPNLQASHLGYRASVLGAVVKLLRITSEYYWLLKFS